ncbi:MAG TPA: hypothetical protein VFM18_20640, partial [Methanosarcina sp.]|nr:hypothetical protein [Methanosarcina sp.]
EQADIDISEGGIEVAVEAEVAADEVVEVEAVEEVAVEAEAVEEVVEKAAEVSEVEGTVEPDFEKMINDLKAFVLEEITKATTVEVDSEKEDLISKSIEDLGGAVATIVESNQALSKTVEALVERLNGVEKSVKSIDKSFATKKSEELGGSSELQKSNNQNNKVWNGTFLGVETL